MTESEGEAYFRDNYPNYELQTSRRKLGFYMNLLRKWIPKGKPIFELGVGMGHFLKTAVSEYECGGCDINEFGLNIARSKVPNANILPGSYECVPMEPPPFAVVAWDVLEHIPELDTALSVIYSRISKGGFLIGVVPVYDGPLGWLVQCLDRDSSHASKLSRREWLSKLKKHNFKVVESGGIIRKLIWNRYYLHITRPQCLMRRIGSAYYFVGQKN
jgi:ubiquinone/menaquinone biosynthesis C-methylase UbiE